MTGVHKAELDMKVRRVQGIEKTPFQHTLVVGVLGCIADCVRDEIPKSCSAASNNWTGCQAGVSS